MELKKYEELIEKRDTYKKRIKEIENELFINNGLKLLLKITEIQRWYFFKNYEMFLFDKNTSLLWPNFTYIYPEKIDKNELSAKSETFEIHGLKNWRIPSRNEKEKTIQPGFPFYEMIQNVENLDIDVFSDFDKIIFAPCNDSFTNNDFTKNNESELLSFFAKNGWIPDLNNEFLENIFMMFLTKENLQNELNKTEFEINNYFNDEKPTTDLNDFKIDSILTQFDLQKINSSLFEYYKSIIYLINLTISELSKNDKNIELINQLNALKKESENDLNGIIKAKTLKELAKAEQKPKPSFDFFVRYLSEKIKLC